MMKKEELDTKLETIKLKNKLDKLKKSTGFVIQSVMFSKKLFDKQKATSWAKNKKFKTNKVKETNNYYHFRQANPKKFKDYKTIKLGEGIKAKVAGDLKSKFVGRVYLKQFSKFGEEIKSDLDIPIPLEVELQILSEGPNRDGYLREEDMAESLENWGKPWMIDFHDMTDMKNPTSHKISDRKGYLKNNARIVSIDGKKWIVNDAVITDRYMAYLIYLREKEEKPLEISPEFGWTPYWVGGKKCQTNIRPHLISIVDKGHIEGNKIRVKNPAS